MVVGMVIALYGWVGYLLPESYIEQSRVARAALWSDTKPTRGTSGTHNGDVRLQYDDIIGLAERKRLTMHLVEARVEGLAWLKVSKLLYTTTAMLSDKFHELR